MTSKLTQGEIGLIYKEALGPILHKYNDMEVIRITKDYHLLPDGTVFEEADLTFQYTGQTPLKEFPWHIPFVSKDSKVIGVRVKPNTSVKGFKSEIQEKLHLITIILESLQAGEHIHLQFEYFTCGAATFETGVFENSINYPMAFVPADTVTSLDIRVHIPLNAKCNTADIDMAKFIEIKKDGEQVLLTSQEQNVVGSVNGNIVIKYKNSIYGAFVSLAAGLIFSSALLILPDFKQVLGIAWYPMVFGLTTLGVFGAYKVIRSNGS